MGIDDGIDGRAIGRATLAACARLDGRGWAVLVLATTGTNLLDFATVPQPGVRPGASFVAAVIVRVAVIFWAAYALQRRLLAISDAFRATPALMRFVVLQFVLLVPVALGAHLARMVAGPDAGLAATWLPNLLVLAAIGLGLVRLLAWNAALAAGARFGALGPLWRAQRGLDGALAHGYAVLVLPPLALHLALTLAAVRGSFGTGGARLALAVVDGGMQAWQLLATLALAAVALGVVERGSVEAAAARR